MKKLGWLVLGVLIACDGLETFSGPLVYIGDNCGIPAVGSSQSISFDSAFCAAHQRDVGKKVTAHGKRVPCGGLLAKGACATVSSATTEAMPMMRTAPPPAAPLPPARPTTPPPPASPPPPVAAHPAAATPPPPPRPVLKPLAPRKK